MEFIRKEAATYLISVAATMWYWEFSGGKVAFLIFLKFLENIGQLKFPK